MNLNDQVEVELTEYGKGILYKYSVYSFENLKDNKLKTELWGLFNIFGPYMFNGSMQIFKDNYIGIL